MAEVRGSSRLDVRGPLWSTNYKKSDVVNVSQQVCELICTEDIIT